MANRNGRNEQGPRQIGAVLKSMPQAKPLTAIQKRILSMPLAEEGDDPKILFQHSVLCQTCLPYRDPGTEVRDWTRRNGYVSLKVVAGSAYSPDQQWLEVGLPFGPKPRLVLYHLNAEAKRTQSPLIDLEDSLTAFVRRTLSLDPGGRNIRVVKDQLTRLSAADFRFGLNREGRGVTIKGSVIEGFELWMPKNDKQRVLWPTTVQFSQRYFESLMEHAVPLNEAAITRIAHNAMALDIYTWLAQRLHRIDKAHAQLVPWVSLKQQFGDGYARMPDFKRIFRSTVRTVQAVYPEAQFTIDGAGMRLAHSKPPVEKRLLLI
jgi:hypothetical protein